MDLTGRYVDLDLLFLFPQKDSRNMGGIEGKGKLSRSTMVESKWGKRWLPKEEEGGLKYPLPSKYDRLGPHRPDYSGPDYCKNLAPEKRLRT